MKIKTSVSLEETLIEQLKVKAANERRSLSQIIELYLEKALGIHQPASSKTAAPVAAAV